MDTRLLVAIETELSAEKPVMLATSVGKKQSRKVSSTFGNRPKPNQTTKSGAIAQPADSRAGT